MKKKKSRHENYIITIRIQGVGHTCANFVGVRIYNLTQNISIEVPM